MSFFLDTNICIYFLKGLNKNLAFKLIETDREKIFIPAIVKAELYYGAEKSLKAQENIKKIDSFCSLFQTAPFDEFSAIYYSFIRSKLEQKGKIIGPNDLIIAATTLSRNGTLVTNNEKEFSRISELKLENWYS
jgi:tRNA(fMet)-specific endonuclease VapC